MALGERAPAGKEKHWTCWAPMVRKVLRQAQFSEYWAELPVWHPAALHAGGWGGKGKRFWKCSCFKHLNVSSSNVDSWTIMYTITFKISGWERIKRKRKERLVQINKIYCKLLPSQFRPCGELPHCEDVSQLPSHSSSLRDSFPPPVQGCLVAPAV